MINHYIPYTKEEADVDQAFLNQKKLDDIANSFTRMSEMQINQHASLPMPKKERKVKYVN